MICDKLNLEKPRILIPAKNKIKKLTTYIPEDKAEDLRVKLFEAGGGNIGNYDQCSFNLNGTGSFRAKDEANPFIGKKGETHYEKETQIGLIFPSHLESIILKTLFTYHPYEEVAYEVNTLNNANQRQGMGMIGELADPMEEITFLEKLKSTFHTGCIKHSTLLGKPVKQVAVLGGSGSFAIENARQSGADFFITADIKYHEFYKAEQSLVIADIGHYESEQYTKDLLHSHLSKKISNFALILSNTKTNPIKYY